MPQIYILFTGPSGHDAPAQPAVISAVSTVVPLPKAHHDKNGELYPELLIRLLFSDCLLFCTLYAVTSMVPPALARRATQKPAAKVPARQPAAKQGFGLVPGAGSGKAEAKGPEKQQAEEKAAGDGSYEAFMESMRELGAF
jgi:hypothetical protein